MKILNIINKLIITITCVSILLAGTGKSVGTAGAMELQIPTGAKGIALNGSNCANVSGVDALYYNPAGISNLGSSVEAQFSNYNYIADIGLSYGALASNIGNGTVGISIKALDFGDIPVTTANDPTGISGKIFSPQFLILTAGYSKPFTDRIRFGASLKLINETIMQTNANGIAIDMGVQYSHTSLPLNLGIVLRNLGPKMQFRGSNLEQSHQPEDSESGALDENLSIIAQSFDLPAALDIAITYSPIPGLDLHGNFSNQSFGFNQFHASGEYNLELGPASIWVGGGLNGYMIDDDTDGWDEDITNNNFGVSLGGGFSVPLSTINLGVDYGIRTSDTFGNTGVLAFNIGF